MDTVSGLSAASASAATGTANGPASRGFGDFDDFLRLLATQLQQQDPLEPLDAKSFTQQLVQYSTVEQAMKANDRIETLIETVRSGQILQASGFVGQTVRLSGSRVFLPEEGTVSFGYTLEEPAASVRALVRDASGRTVAELGGLPGGRGAQEAVWDGRDRLGRRLSSGFYEIAVEATAADGRPVSAELQVIGRVDGIRFDGERLLLNVGGRLYPAADVVAVGDDAA